MKKILLSGLLAASASAPAMAQDLDITLYNLTHGSHFTPVIVAAHPNTVSMFQLGTNASANLQTMAEGGDISGLASDLVAVAADTVENPAGGLLAPGGSTNFQLTATDGNDYLSVAAMILPSNDGFVGLNSLHIPTEAGRYVYTLNAYDAGTEANDEIVNGGGASGTPGIPIDPLGENGTGATGVATTDSNTTVHIHRGVLGDTDDTGGASDLDSRVHRWLNPVARIVINVQ